MSWTENWQLQQDEAGDGLPDELRDLGNCIAELPAKKRDRVARRYERVVEMVQHRRRILSRVQEALSQLRLDVKYLMFDLEVTRKERDELQQRLENHDLDF